MTIPNGFFFQTKTSFPQKTTRPLRLFGRSQGGQPPSRSQRGSLPPNDSGRIRGPRRTWQSPSWLDGGLMVLPETNREVLENNRPDPIKELHLQTIDFKGLCQFQGEYITCSYLFYLFANIAGTWHDHCAAFDKVYHVLQVLAILGCWISQT